MSGSERVWRIWGDLLYSVQTGEPATPHLYGVGVFEYLATHRQEAAIFNAAMAEVTRRVTDAVVAACDFRRFGSIVDVGGGNGALIAAILAATPKLKGVVFDLPSGSADALRHLAAAGVADRSEVVAGDFFRSVPAGADAYILKSIIHDWDDERSVEILTSCRQAMQKCSTLLLIERVMPQKMETSARLQQMALLDVHMLVGPGGRERTEAEFRKLFAAAGFRWVTAAPLPGDFGPSLIEGRPA
jgi:orsellinic acid C2-O-methyltransferase